MNIFSSSSGRAHHTHTSKHADPRGHLPSRHALPAEDGQAAEGGFAAAFMAALFALPVAVIIGLVLLLIVTAVAYADPDPDRLTTPLSLGALGLTALLDGLVAARRGRGQPLLGGLLSGLLLALLLLGLSLFFGDEARAQLTLGASALVRWGLHGGVVALSLLGAKLGSRRAKINQGHQTRR